MMNHTSDIQNIETRNDAIRVAKQILQISLDLNARVLDVQYLTGKSRKALTHKMDGWLLCFELPVPEGFYPDCIWVELYPGLGTFEIPSLL